LQKVQNIVWISHPARLLTKTDILKDMSCGFEPVIFSNVFRVDDDMS